MPSIPTAPSVHDVGRKIVIFDGVRIPPSGDTTFAEHAFPEEFTSYIDNGGSVVFSVNPDKSVDVTITVSPNSVAHKRLGVILKKQGGIIAAASNQVGFSYQYRDFNNGDFVSAEAAVITQAPNMNANREHEDVTWTIKLSTSIKGYGTVIPDTLQAA